MSHKRICGHAVLHCPSSLSGWIISSALCYCTAELLSSRGRPSSSVRALFVDIVFSDTTEWINAKFGGQVPIHHISRPIFFFVLFFKIFNFLFFVNYGTIWEKKFKRHLIWKYTSHSLPKTMHTSRKGLYQSCSKNCEISNFGFLSFFFVFVNMGPYGGKSFKRDLLWNNTPDLLSKIDVYSWGGSLTTFLKE